MKYTVTYPSGGIDIFWEPMHITANLEAITGLTIEGRTSGRDGCKLRLLDENKQEMGTYHYTSGAMTGPINPWTVARDVADDMNILLELSGKKIRIEPKSLEPVMKAVVTKCEARYGNPIPLSDYEALVIFVE